MLEMRQEREEARDAQLAALRWLAGHGKKKVSTTMVIRLFLDALRDQGWRIDAKLLDAVDGGEDFFLIEKLLRENNVK